MVRINLNLAEDLVKDIDAYAKSLHITRTAAISVLCSNALQGIKTVDVVETMMNAYQAEQAKQGKKSKKQLPG